MTPTEKLRKMLDEHGVRWMSAYKMERKTIWPSSNGIRATATDWDNELFVQAVMTPEQAIAATLDETCHDVSVSDYRFECSKCGYEYDSTGGFGCDFGSEPDFSYCPNCGRRVVS